MPDAGVKLCECGCGEPAPISPVNHRANGYVKGEPRRFIKGHHLDRAGRIANANRAAAVRTRREEVARLYSSGRSLNDIAAQLGMSKATVASDVQRLRANGIDLPRRADGPKGRPLNRGIADEVCKAWNDELLSVQAIAERLGWEHGQAQAFVAKLRSAGFALHLRRGRPIALGRDERRQVAREFKKRNVPRAEGILSSEAQAMLRLLQAAKRPLAVAEMHTLLQAAGVNLTGPAVNSRLSRLRKRGFVDSVTVPQPHRKWFDRQLRWFVPLGAEQPAEKLTLADAERETELAALIESQQNELQRGDWIDSEKGHWADKSIDAPLTADGFTISDTLGDEDVALQELIGEPA